MGRPSVLNPRAKSEILRRLAMGEKRSALRKEFKLTETTFRRNFSADVSKVREVGTALATAEMALASLPISAQVSARTLADHLQGITRHAAEAAATGMQTAAILQNRALKSVRAMESQETQSPEDLRMADACLTVAGKASALGTQLMQANRDSGKPGQPTLEDIITGKAAL